MKKNGGNYTLAFKRDMLDALGGLVSFQFKADVAS
jgi:hypothetical protein